MMVQCSGSSVEGCRAGDEEPGFALFTIKHLGGDALEP